MHKFAERFNGKCLSEKYVNYRDKNMKVWIEISSDYHFDKKLNGELWLFAPASKRYKNMMHGVDKDDLILHYINKQRAKKEHKSSIIAISKVKSGTREEQTRIYVDLKDILSLLTPVKKDEIQAIAKKSENLEKLIRMNFLRYLTEISREDLWGILSIHEENMRFLEQQNLFKEIIGK